MVPGATIAVTTITALVCIAAPVALYLYLRTKLEMKPAPMLLGIVVFFAFTILIQQTLNTLILNPDIDGNVALIDNNPWLFILYIITASAIVNETGRFASFQVLKRKYPQPGTALSFGIGNGGMDALFFVGLSMISNAAVSMRINSGEFETAGADEYTLGLISSLISTPPTVYLVGCMTALITIVTSLSLSVIVYGSVAMKGRLWLYPAAIVLQAALGLAPAMYQVGYFAGMWTVIILMLIPAALITAAGYRVWKEIKLCE